MPHRSAASPRPRAIIGTSTLLVLACSLLRMDVGPLLAPRPLAAAAPDTLAWQRLPDGPAVAGHAAVLHGETQRSRMITFGGRAGPSATRQGMQVLEIQPDHATWRPYTSTGAPRGSSGATVGAGSRMALDAREGVALLRCDCTAPAAYTLDLETGAWSALPGEAQRPLIGGLLAYDERQDRALHAGGDLLGLGSLVSDTVAHDLSPRRAGSRALPATPFRLVYQAADVDPRSGHWVAFGGQGVDGSATAELWRAALAEIEREGAWQRITAGEASRAGPAARTGASLTFLGRSGWALLFGGYDPERTEQAEPWLLDYRRPESPVWLELAAAPDEGAGRPEARAGHVAVWDPLTASVVIYGGIVSEGRQARYLGDSWLLRASQPGPAEPTLYLPRLTRR